VEEREEARDVDAERIEGKRPAGPEQGDEGFATGYPDETPDPEEELVEPNFARGISEEPVPGTQHHGRFSEGEEELPDSPEKDIERRFSEGSERSPTSE
jgi:hypothetical protein